ncbi:MAG: hypothetical protein ACRDY7_02315 [Acidimicrobiia bacterium]
MRSFRRFPVAAALLAAVTLTPLAPAGAAGTECTFAADIVISPGVGAAPNTGSFTTNGPVGSVDCGGSPGTMGFEGNYGTKDPDSCGGAFVNGNEGDGKFAMNTPAGGELSDAFTFVYGTLSSNGGVVEGSFTSERFSGVFQLAPTAGDCFSSPITKARITGQGTLS